ncbi:Uu.00g058030.m01.CDS01 [Anthostomella pinea]|uniref:Uu.00g058030.m01.CDS01 n=1 Tax=Anthostomella pinea TaxID=933095 RepID=A0AAI8YM39_9PEZI|nr:Uu.00g058030.m01.CDS01 [Anthostomella pinea]
MAPSHPADADELGISSDDDASDLENKVTLESINQRMTIRSAITSNYATQWGAVEAFRELVQNWRDGIIKSFKIYECDFHVTLEENDDEIVYKAVGPKSQRRKSQGTQECLGYIRWHRNEGAGIVEITNRQATLQSWHLDMGGSSKQNDSHQAGSHGEGLKVALLILSLLPIAPAPNEDVQFFVGGNTPGRDENGYPTQRIEVTKDKFREWTKAALFLQTIPDEEIVRTKLGDLIIDARFSGNIYLKGLLLKECKGSKSASIAGKKIMYGYSFASGVTNREIESMAGADDESRAILNIWNLALTDPSKPPDLVNKLHEMLDSDNPEYADVARAETFIHSGTREHIKKYLLSEKFEGKWFYTAKEKNQNRRVEQVVQGLGREPLMLKDSYWLIMKAAGLRTADEERKRFLAAADAPVPDDVFSKAVHRLVRAGLAACPQTSGLSVLFVKAGWLGLDSFYAEPQKAFKIHEKWLTAKGAQEELGLDGSKQPSWYLKRALSESDQHVQEHIQIKQDLEFKINRFEKTDSVITTWNAGSGWTPDTDITIHLHNEVTCLHHKQHLIREEITKAHLQCLKVVNRSRFAVPSVPAADKKIFVLLSNLSDPYSFVVLSEEPRIIEMPTPVATPATPSRVRESPKPDEQKTYTLGDQMQSLDIVTPRDWYHGSNPKGTKAVIGIEKSESEAVAVTKDNETPAKRPLPELETLDRMVKRRRGR